MATLLFSALGSLVGGPVGGFIGAMAGRQADMAIFGGGTREGPRLNELAITTSTYGTILPRVLGRMRIPGTIIWSTDLIEHSDRQGGGKGRPSVTTYSYSVSFAVALTSSPLAAIGRIWADGQLLRGAAGDLKVGGSIRFYPGSGNQPADPLIAAAEGIARCPAFRGLAYVVFEDLQLADFGNRIPTLSFEVFATDDHEGEGAINLEPLFTDSLDKVDASVSLAGIAGLSCESALADTLARIAPACPLHCDVSGDYLSIGAEREGPAIALGEPAVNVADDAFGRYRGYLRSRKAAPAANPGALRYFDVERDYLPGLQIAPGMAGPGQWGAADVPLAMTATRARDLAARMAQRAGSTAQSLAWRSAELDPAVVPGALVTVPGQTGTWRVANWEWRDSGVELLLKRVIVAGTAGQGASADPGRLNNPADARNGPTVLVAFELPWDGLGSGDSPLIRVAAGSAFTGWSGAAPYADGGDGQLIALGASGRRCATIGTALNALPPGHPCLIDRQSVLDVRLARSDQLLTSTTVAQLTAGANRALIGDELIQFLNAQPLGSGRWRLTHLLRGRAGSEAAIAGHLADEPFVLLDDRLTEIDAGKVPDLPQVRIGGLGLADADLVHSPIRCRGIARRPLSPVHPRCRQLADGGIALSWTRRARGAWAWPDLIEPPLNEQGEAYRITVGSTAAPLATWETGIASLVLDHAALSSVRTRFPGQPVQVRQQGAGGLSEPLLLTHLT